MTKGNGDQSAHEPHSADELVRLVASLQAPLERLVSSERVTRDEIKALARKLDGFDSRIDQLAERVHRSSNIAQALNEQLELSARSQEALDRALEVFESLAKAKVIELERAHDALERTVAILEGRLRHVRDEVADLRTAERSDDK